MKLILASLMAIGLVAPLAVWSAAETRRETGVEYITAPVEIRSIRQSITALGRLKAVSTVEVGAQQSGQIRDLFADFNDKVTAGQPLAAMDSRALVLELEQAQAELAIAVADLEILNAQLEAAQAALEQGQAEHHALAAQVSRASALSDATRVRLLRAENLFARKAGTQSSVDDARAEEAEAAALLSEATARLAAHAHSIDGLAAQLEEAQAAIPKGRSEIAARRTAAKLVELELDRATIRSPADGVVIGRTVERGQTVASSLDAPVLFVIAGDLAQMEIEANIDEADIGRVAVGQTATFEVDAIDRRRFDATVRQIRLAPTVVQGVVTYTVVLSAANADGLLLPGMTATIEIVTEETPPGPAIPLAALSFDPGHGNAPAWYVAENGHLAPVDADTGQTDGLYVALNGNVPKSGQVVIGHASVPSKSLF